MSELSRRGFFGALGTKALGREKKVRPPYIEDETLFATACQECPGKCAMLCEEEIIKIAKDKTPYLDFSQNGCTYCEACIEACEFGVIVNNEIPIQSKITINSEKCMSWFDTICFTCKEPCLDDAIIFAGLYKPEIESDRCTACGFCIARCPTQAIEVVV